MSSFDDAIAGARRDAEYHDRLEVSQQNYEDEFDRQIGQILAEAAERFRELPDALRLQLVRPKKRFERANTDIADTAGKRYVVVDEHRCWVVPPYGNRSHGSDVLFTEHGALLYVRIRPGPPIHGGPPKVHNPDPTAIVVTQAPPAVDVRKEFLHGRSISGEDDPRAPILDALRKALAQSFIAYERAIRNVEPLGDLFQKWPIEWRRG